MSVRCAGCGRAYDDGLFESGRTIWCTCGRRVGAPVRARRLGPEPRFLADAMLGRLARWLRLLGFDCAWEADIEDEALVRRALDEGRVLLSRDRALIDEWRVSDLYLVRSESVAGQLREVIDGFALVGRARPLSRCSRCNPLLRPTTPEQVPGRIPPRVLARCRVFLTCPGCDRVYWEGTHTDRIRRLLEELIPRTADDGSAPEE
jgi:uncharacterized protein with PIN domain